MTDPLPKDLQLKPNEYQCAQCGGVYEKAWSDEEALAERKANGWGDWPDGVMAVVCDDCYKELVP